MPNFTKYLITLSATTAILSTVALCSFCSCVSPLTNTKKLAALEEEQVQEDHRDYFYTPFGINTEEDETRAYMMNVIVYDAHGEIEDVYEPIVRDSNACSE
tara:strand:- start:797 stop:1099 length:303 start_codon:yes stop_codon:yes gene_type:complete